VDSWCKDYFLAVAISRAWPLSLPEFCGYGGQRAVILPWNFPSFWGKLESESRAIQWAGRVRGGMIMAEIKSAVELAMERTKGFRLSDEEIEKWKEEEIQAKAHGLVNRYLEVDFHLRDVERELEKFDPSQRQRLKSLFIHYLSAAIDLDRDNDLIFQGIESFREESKPFLQKLRALVRKYQERKGKEFLKTEEDLLVILEHLGISGSAVQARVEGSPEWEEALAGFKPGFEEELKTIREAIGA
jgi:hypothetical protein